MDDLISKERLLKDIEETVIFTVKDGVPSAEMRGANKIIDRIKAASAVDAVRVVRCKDCEFAAEIENHAMKFYFDTEKTKNCLLGRGILGFSISAVGLDNYCSDGRLRTDLARLLEEKRNEKKERVMTDLIEQTCENCLHAERCAVYADDVGADDCWNMEWYEECGGFKAKTRYIPVTFCKECTQWGGVAFGNICRRWSAPLAGMKNCTGPDDFCSYGERREDNG